MEILDMLKELGTLSPIILLMGLFVFYLYKRKNELYIELKETRESKEEMSKDLNSQIRELEKETLTTLSKLADALEKLHNNDKVFMVEIKNLKDFIQLKFEILKNNNKDE